MKQRILIRDIVERGCVVCRCDEFQRGPKGGLSRMFRCCKCGTEYCLYPTGEVEIVRVVSKAVTVYQDS